MLTVEQLKNWLNDGFNDSDDVTANYYENINAIELEITRTDGTICTVTVFE